MVDSLICSWSGGKDSLLALYRAIRQGGKPQYLMTMFNENHERSRSHGLTLNILERQAQALGLPLITCSASWDTYEDVFLKQLKQFKQQGIETAVFGDIDLEGHRLWVEKVCSQAGMRPLLPLWQEKRLQLVYEFIDSGFKAVIVALKDGVVDRAFLGRTLTREAVIELIDQGVDPSGEGGEFHTVVIDGPLFKFPLDLTYGKSYLVDGYWFMDVDCSDNQGR